jgi:uncharacterized protein YlzI (FlbEa/FlbD family)
MSIVDNSVEFTATDGDRAIIDIDSIEYIKGSNTRTFILFGVGNFVHVDLSVDEVYSRVEKAKRNQSVSRAMGVSNYG